MIQMVHDHCSVGGPKLFSSALPSAVVVTSQQIGQARASQHLQVTVPCRAAVFKGGGLRWVLLGTYFLKIKVTGTWVRIMGADSRVGIVRKGNRS